jgi:hypothetical protein
MLAPHLSSPISSSLLIKGAWFLASSERSFSIVLPPFSDAAGGEHYNSIKVFCCLFLRLVV